jgi:DNA repair exonuclease SbcCD ATPase subunit
MQDAGERAVIEFTHMTIANFLSFGETEVGLRDQGLTLIDGDNRDDDTAASNGAGKSALIDALVWCLFGTTLRGYENDEVINRRVGNDCLVTVVFEGGEAREQFVITRARRHSKFKNQLRVARDDGHEDMTLASNAETQGVVEKLIGCSLRTFLSSVVFGQDRAYRFSSLTDKEQKDVLDEVLGVERFAEACTAARALSSACDAAVLNADQALDKARTAHEQVSEELDELNEKNAKFEQLHEEKLDDEHVKLKNAQKRVDQAEVDADATVLRSKLIAARDAHESADEEIVKLSRTTNGLYRDSESARVAVASLAATLESLSSKKTCPTCGQALKREKVDVASIEAELQKLQERLKDVETAYGAADLAEKKARAASVKRSASIREIEAGVVRAHSAEADAKAFRMRVDDHRRRIKEIETETNPYAPMIEKAEKKLAKLGKERQLLEQQLEAEKARQKVVRFWVDAFGTKGLRSLLLDTSLPILNAEARRISNAITGGSISIEFSATSELKNGKTVERFEVRVDNKHGAESYKGNSAGERAKVDLCVGLAIQRLVASRSSSTFNTIFIDEAFDHLDSTAHELVLEVLGEVKKESIFVVSHDEDLKAFFPNTMTVRKKNGFSVVIQ